MKCPRCENAISELGGRSACVNGVDVLMVICPRCETILGVVHLSHSSYFSQECTRGAGRGRNDKHADPLTATAG